MHDVYQLRSGGTCTPFTGPTFQLNQYRNAQFLNSIIHISIFIEFLNGLDMVFLKGVNLAEETLPSACPANAMQRTSLRKSHPAASIQTTTPLWTEQNFSL